MKLEKAEDRRPVKPAMTRVRRLNSIIFDREKSRLGIPSDSVTGTANMIKSMMHTAIPRAAPAKLMIAASIVIIEVTCLFLAPRVNRIPNYFFLSFMIMENKTVSAIVVVIYISKESITL